jgi:DNA-binding transcriptional MerR regulator/methylmalonyl-CoA mutase cobalamin-binding subunit
MSAPRYRIGTLARLTGITTHAIRIWERRYGALKPDRTPGGARLYTEDDVLRLRMIKKLLDRGYTISAIANMSIEQLSELVPKDPLLRSEQTKPADAPRARAFIDELLAAVAELDLERAGLVLVQAGNAFSPHDLVTQILGPALDEIGERWETGEICIASEHAASAMLRTQLGALLASQPVNGKRPVVCTTPAGEQHELGALLAAVVVAMHGRRAIFLGANLPAQQIAEAARLAGAGSVALSLVGLAPESAAREIAALCRVLPKDIEVLVGGRGVFDVAGLPERVQVLHGLAELETWLETAPN